jgi:hypothetical protein
MASIAFAGAGNRTGTGGAAELLIPTGTRDIGLGGSTVATTHGIEALHWNPAGSAKMAEGASVYASHMNYIADIGVDYAAAAVNFEGFGVLALNVKSLAIGDIVETTNEYPDGTGKTFSPQFFTIGFTYARQLSERVGVGLTTNLVSERMGDVSATGIAFNIGVVYDNLAAVDGLSLGVVVKNIGPQMTFDGGGLLYIADGQDFTRPPGYYKTEAASFELPSTVEFGLGYRRSIGSDNVLLLSTAFQNNNFSDDEYRLGAEFGYQDLLFLRGGLNLSAKESEREYVYGPSAGVGVHYAFSGVDVTVDYAFRAVDIFDSNHIFSVKLGF